MNIIRNLTFAILATTLLLQAAPSARAADHGPRSISFEKFWDGTGYTGTVSGDCGDGAVVFRFVAAPWGENVWHIAGAYMIETDGCSFTAVCSGVLDVRSGHIVLNGMVTEGAFQGAQVQVRAEASADLGYSHGTITITPSK